MDSQMESEEMEIMILPTLIRQAYDSAYDSIFDFTSSIKVAEHSFCARFRWCNSARAQGFQKTNMTSIERSFYLLNTRTHCVIFLYIKLNAVYRWL